MSQVVLNPTLRSQLNGLSETVEVLDEAGRTVGRFVPEETYRRLLYDAAEAACPHTKEELSRRRKETGGKPLAEIWKRLGCA